jgi:hypothetical protein
MGAAFWMTFKNLDIKPLKWQLKFYYYIVMPIILVFYAFVILLFKKIAEARG